MHHFAKTNGIEGFTPVKDENGNWCVATCERGEKHLDNDDYGPRGYAVAAQVARRMTHRLHRENEVRRAYRKAEVALTALEAPLLALAEVACKPKYDGLRPQLNVHEELVATAILIRDRKEIPNTTEDAVRRLAHARHSYHHLLAARTFVAGW